MAVVELLAARSPATVSWPGYYEAHIALPAGGLVVQLLHPHAPPSPLGTIALRWSGSLDVGSYSGPASQQAEVTLAYLPGALKWARLPAEHRGSTLPTPVTTGTVN